jgi:uncharacterized protein with PIN domain
MDTEVASIGFVADQTVGKLAKWLRILGFDVRYEPELPKRSKALDISTKRVWLTRSRYHYQNDPGKKILRLTSDNALQQLSEVVSALDLNVGMLKPCSRCIRCNVPTTVIDKAEILGKVPDYVWETQTTFHQCDRCQQIYWPGSHYKKIQATISKVMQRQKAPDVPRA